MCGPPLSGIKGGGGADIMMNYVIGSKRMIKYGVGSEMIITETKRLNRKPFQNVFLNISCFSKLHFTFLKKKNNVIIYNFKFFIVWFIAAMYE